MTTPYTFTQGTSPLLISIPHMGQEIPPHIKSRMTPIAHQVPDTDWHLDILYDFAQQMGASLLHARYSRYVVDLNRPPTDDNLYPGQTKTGLYPEYTFRGEPIYLEGQGVTEQEKSERLEQYWKPYHQRLQQALADIVQQHGQVLLWEGHSIASVLPRLFPGKLPDLNIGTSDGKSCDGKLLQAVEASLTDCPFTWVANGRFKGGYITRQYGDPSKGIHAIQLEMCHSTYMNEDYPFEYRKAVADEVKPYVQGMVSAAFSAMTRSGG